ncbi:hypothetical protein GGX14DRAFT_564273 [Mycena pura]|uniref:Uncharacterized protein n=1 Tax=Mycena pura TaxID=153505 RepID=A0AAD6YD00_9AGAR|nr:hypothetical protein GGX14DRAFT_564273 [Mycena pura]
MRTVKAQALIHSSLGVARTREFILDSDRTSHIVPASLHSAPQSSAINHCRPYRQSPFYTMQTTLPASLCAPRVPRRSDEDDAMLRSTAPRAPPSTASIRPRQFGSGRPPPIRQPRREYHRLLDRALAQALRPHFLGVHARAISLSSHSPANARNSETLRVAHSLGLDAALLAIILSPSDSRSTPGLFLVVCATIPHIPTAATPPAPAAPTGSSRPAPGRRQAASPHLRPARSMRPRHSRRTAHRLPAQGPSPLHWPALSETRANSTALHFTAPQRKRSRPAPPGIYGTLTPCLQNASAPRRPAVCTRFARPDVRCLRQRPARAQRPWTACARSTRSLPAMLPPALSLPSLSRFLLSDARRHPSGHASTSLHQSLPLPPTRRPFPVVRCLHARNAARRSPLLATSPTLLTRRTRTRTLAVMKHMPHGAWSHSSMDPISTDLRRVKTWPLLLPRSRIRASLSIGGWDLRRRALILFFLNHHLLRDSPSPAYRQRANDVAEQLEGRHGAVGESREPRRSCWRGKSGICIAVADPQIPQRTLKHAALTSTLRLGCHLRHIMPRSQHFRPYTRREQQRAPCSFPLP